MNIEHIRNAWNAQADEYNQWDSLDADERVSFALQQANNETADVNGALLNEQAALLRECRSALDDLLGKRPGLAGLLCGSTTLGNLKAELHNPHLNSTIFHRNNP